MTDLDGPIELVGVSFRYDECMPMEMNTMISEGKFAASMKHQLLEVSVG